MRGLAERKAAKMVTLAERHAIARFQVFLKIAKNDVDAATVLHKKMAPRDYKRHGQLLRRILKKAAA